MALIDQLYSDGSPSRLDQPIGIKEGRERQAKDRAFANAEQLMKKQQRLGRRAYRNAMRSDNPSAQMAVMERMGPMDEGFFTGIKQAGQTSAAMRSRFESTQQQVAFQQGGGRPLQGSQRPAGMSEGQWAQQNQSPVGPDQGVSLSARSMMNSADYGLGAMNAVSGPDPVTGAQVPAQTPGPLEKRLGIKTFNQQRADFGRDLQSSELLKSGED